MHSVKKIVRFILLGAILLVLSLGYKLLGSKDKANQKALLFDADFIGAEGPGPAPAPAPGPDDS